MPFYDVSLFFAGWKQSFASSLSALIRYNGFERIEPGRGDRFSQSGQEGEGQSGRSDWFFHACQVGSFTLVG